VVLCAEANKMFMRTADSPAKCVHHPEQSASHKDGLQPETLADGNWLVKQNQPVSKIETKSDTNLRSLYES
jgi:hypothetical protein